MKKLFTLIVMAMMAISANAKVDIDFSAVGTAGETITFGDWDEKFFRKTRRTLASNQVDVFPWNHFFLQTRKHL